MSEGKKVKSCGKMEIPGEIDGIFSLASDIFKTVLHDKIGQNKELREWFEGHNFRYVFECNEKGWSEAVYVDEDDIDVKEVTNESFLGTPHGDETHNDNTPAEA